MPFLQLENIGKIYVSDNSVAVGIRGVNLSFDLGEFVAITGKSGSGKSTLLNIISGMDTYEEGELYLRGEPTSHYVQSDWEEYRKQNISFIFQEYNILESFTVLENVELALMTIEDKKERRAKALELLNRVGLSQFIHSKGSKLSGGQKQRTVIARALAKDSPIILADEPTGNLDSKTSEEIIQLLKEVSKDKLVIVVTHNYEQVENVATRHIRIYDGSIESDQRVQEKREVQEKVKKQSEQKRSQTIKDGFELGFSMFKSKPKLSAFLCFLLIVGSLGVFLLTALNGTSIAALFQKNYMFTPMEGRVVIAKLDESTISPSELSTLQTKYGAKDSLHFDELLDDTSVYIEKRVGYYYESYHFQISYKEEVKGNYEGRLPSQENEIFLRMPISYKPLLEDMPLEGATLRLFENEWTISGIQYYRDNTKQATIITTPKGYRALNALYVLNEKSRYITSSAYAVMTGNTLSTQDNEVVGEQNTYFFPYISTQDTCFYFLPNESTLSQMRSTTSGENFANWDIDFVFTFKDLNLGYTKVLSIPQYKMESSAPTIATGTNEYQQWEPYMGAVYLSYDILIDLAEEYLNATYKQSSLFFSSNKEASKVIDSLREDGYIAVLSNATYVSEMDSLLNVLGSIGEFFSWVLGILFIAFFVNLCSGRAIAATRDDLAIMRSMGIPVKVIRFSIYVRMMFALIPCAFVVAGLSVFIYSFPVTSGTFMYLHVPHYLVIALGMLIISYRVARNQLKRLFGSSVKNTLRGGVDA